MVQNVVVRKRRNADLDACGELLRTTHHEDGYPARLPDDLRDFIRSRDAVDAWVATRAGTLTGHVALHGSSSQPVMALAVESGTRSASSAATVNGARRVPSRARTEVSCSRSNT